jgi:hypothetical protein
MLKPLFINGRNQIGSIQPACGLQRGDLLVGKSTSSGDFVINVKISLAIVAVVAVAAVKTAGAARAEASAARTSDLEIAHQAHDR